MDEKNIRSRVQEDGDLIAFAKDMNLRMSFAIIIRFSFSYKGIWPFFH